MYGQVVLQLNRLLLDQRGGRALALRVWQAAYRSEDYDRAFVYNISICEELPVTGGCEGAAVCMQSPASDGVVKIGDFNSSASLELTEGKSSKSEFRLQYSAKCHANPKAKGNVTIEFWCGTSLVSTCT